MRDLVAHCSAYDLLSAVDDGVIGAVITDPPEVVTDAKSVIRQVGRVLRPGGGLVVIGSSPRALAVWERLGPKAGLHRMAEVVVLWDSGKPRTRNFGSLHTRVIWYTKGGNRHTFNMDLDVIPGREMFSNVVIVKRVPVLERVHPSEKPVGLTNFLVSLLTNTGDVVVDPYCGSGSTLVSAVQCGRGYLGADIDEWHVRTAQRRIGHADLELPEPVYLWVNGVQHEI